MIVEKMILKLGNIHNHYCYLKHKCDDDGTFGMATGLAMFGQFMNRQYEDNKN